jgi:hypothetical protein
VLQYFADSLESGDEKQLLKDLFGENIATSQLFQDLHISTMGKVI